MANSSAKTSGIVKTVGEGVTRCSVGDRVSPQLFQTWLRGRLTFAAFTLLVVRPRVSELAHLEPRRLRDQ